MVLEALHAFQGSDCRRYKIRWYSWARVHSSGFWNSVHNATRSLRPICNYVSEIILPTENGYGDVLKDISAIAYSFQFDNVNNLKGAMRGNNTGAQSMDITGVPLKYTSQY